MKKTDNTPERAEDKTGHPLRILISGGGTGGHIFPALSIAEAVRRRHPDADILFVGAEGRMEMERVPAAGYAIEGLPVEGFDRKHPWRNVRVLWKLLGSLRKARSIVRRFRPDIAVGVGGYASGPTLKAAQRQGIPTLLQEQNSFAGVTNKLLAKKALRICTAYDGMDRFFPAESIILTGNPVRKALTECALTRAQAKEELGFDPTKPLVLITGGSLGARTLNNAMIDAIENGLLTGEYSILWQTGKSDAARCREVADRADKNIVKADVFISDMAKAYRAADLVVARAGAGTISELQLLGKPAILVPSPNVAEDHQRHNAEALADKGAAVMILDAKAQDLTERPLLRSIESLVSDPAALAGLETNISAMAMTDSDERIADEIDKIVLH